MRIAESIAIIPDLGRVNFSINRYGHFLTLVMSIVLWAGLIAGVSSMWTFLRSQSAHTLVEPAVAVEEMAKAIDVEERQTIPQQFYALHAVNEHYL